MKPKFESGHISFSQLRAFSECKRFYKEYYGKDETRAAVYGSFLHDVLSASNKFIKGLADINSLSMSDIEQIYSKEFKKINLSLEDYKSGYEKIEHIALETFTNKANIFLAEEELNIELYDEERKKSIILTIRMDRVDRYLGGLKIIDYKLSPLIPSRDEVTNSFQLNIYALVMHELQPSLPLWLEQYSISAGKGVIVQVDEAVVQKTKDYIIDLWQKMEDEKDWKAEKINNMCQYCPQVCEIYKKAMFEKYESKGIKDAESALKHFEKVRLTRLLAQKEEESIKDFLQIEWEKKDGKPFEVCGKCVNFKTMSRKGKKVDEEKICKDRECPAISFTDSPYQQLDISEVAKEVKDLVGKIAKKGKKNV